MQTVSQNLPKLIWKLHFRRKRHHDLGRRDDSPDVEKVQNVDLPAEFPRMPYAEAMSRYGSDKPDMRVTLEITELSDVMKDVDFKVFSGPANSDNGRVAAIRVPNGAEISRKEIDAYTEFVKIYGAKVWLTSRSMM